MKKIPISLIIDDPAPLVSVYAAHADTPFTKDRRPMIETFPNDLLFRFCDVIEKHGIKGKFSVVPMPANKGDIINGLEGIDQQQVDEWLDCVRTRVTPAFSICPEMLSHNKAVDIETGKALPLREDVWESTQDRTTLTPYITRALEILKEAKFDVHGVISPWYFGKEVEEEYIAALSKAMYDVYGYKNCFYFLHQLRGVPGGVKPWIAYEEDDRCVVSIPGVKRDSFWETIDSTRTDDEFISHVADHYITADGKGGCIIHELELGANLTVCTHWQSLCSNGLGTGIRALEEVAKRVEKHLSDRVEWTSFNELLETTINDKNAYRARPVSMQKIDIEF